MMSLPPPGTGAKKRPISARGRSAFAPPVTNIAPPIAGATKAAGGPVAQAAASAAAAVSSVPQSQHAHSHMFHHKESELIANLKEQVLCLELELNYLRQQPAGAAAGPSPPSAQFLPARSSEVASRPTSAAGPSDDFRVAHAELRAQADALEREVQDLRKRFADREKEHQLELAHARAGSDTLGLHGTQAHHHLKHELHQAKDAHRDEVAALKEAHAQEVVTLQKTVERVNIEYQSHYAELQAAVRERDALLKDLSVHKEELRTLRQSFDTLKRQYDETHRMLSSEQEQRRKLDAKEKELRQIVLSGQTEQVTELQRKLAANEARMAEQVKETSLALYESDQTKLANRRLHEEIAKLVADKGQLNEALHQSKQQQDDAHRKVYDLTSAAADIAAERDYYRLQLDRLKIDHSVTDVKASQLEARAEADKASYLALERQYCSALETIDTLRRDAKAKEKVYEQLDANDTKLRKANFMLTEELASVRHAVSGLKTSLSETHDKYEANRGLAEQARTEQHLAMTLTKLDKMKNELHNLLGTQIRLSQDLTQSMLDLPDSSAVIRALTPHGMLTFHHPQAQSVLVSQSVAAGDVSNIAGTPRPTSAEWLQPRAQPVPVPLPQGLSADSTTGQRPLQPPAPPSVAMSSQPIPPQVTFADILTPTSVVTQTPMNRLPTSPPSAPLPLGQEFRPNEV